MKKRALPIFVGLMMLLAFAAFHLNGFPLLDGLRRDSDEFLYDSALRVGLLAPRNLPTGLESIVIVDIDENSIQTLGRWPWSRSKIAELIESIRNLGAIVIALDVLFSESQENPVDQILKKATGPLSLDQKSQASLQKLSPLFEYDEILRKSLENEDTAMGFLLNDVLEQESYGALPEPLIKVDDLAQTSIIRLRRYFANLESLQKTAGYGGFITALPDRDGVIRKAPLVLGFENGVYPSLSLEAARMALLFEKKDIKIQWGTFDDLQVIDGIWFGKDFIPTDTEGRVLVPYAPAKTRFPGYSAAQVLKGDVPTDALKNAVVFLGSSALSLSDFHATPIDPTFPGVYIHAFLLEGILSGEFLHSPYYASAISFLALIVVGLALALVLPFLDAIWMIFAFLAALLSVLILYCVLFRFNNTLISVSLPIFLSFFEIGFNITYGMLFEFRRRSQLKNIFGQYVPKEIVERMSEHPELYSMDGSSENLTVLFADVVHFTSVSENLTPKQLRRLLNRYFTPMTKIILDNQGTIDKYVGDMIMAFWGAPLSDPNHAKNALNSALEMQKMVDELGPQFESEGLPYIKMGIGLNTGVMSVGDMGSEYRRAYTVLGDKVNTASRIEGLTRFYGVKIAVGPQTQAGQSEFVFKLLDRVRVKGKEEALEVFELVSRIDEANAEIIAESALHNEAIEYYFTRRFDEAVNIFQKLHENSDNKLLYELYLDRIEKFKIDPPPETWDGSTQWTQK